jgi:hypothetical protein
MKSNLKAYQTNAYRRLPFLPRLVYKKGNLIHSYDALTKYKFLETSGRSLEEVDDIFENTTGIFSAVRVAKNLPRKHVVRHGVAVIGKEEQGTNHNQEILEASENAVH